MAKTVAYAPSMKRVYQLHSALTKIANQQGAKYGEYGIVSASYKEVKQADARLDISNTYVATILSYLEQHQFVLRLEEDEKNPFRWDIRQFLRKDSLTRLVDLANEQNELAREDYHNRKNGTAKQAITNATVTTAPAAPVEPTVVPVEDTITRVEEGIQLSAQIPATNQELLKEVQTTVVDGVGHLTEAANGLKDYLLELQKQIEFANPAEIEELKAEKQKAQEKIHELEASQTQIATDLNASRRNLEVAEKMNLELQKQLQDQTESAENSVKELQAQIAKLQEQVKEAEATTTLSDGVALSIKGLQSNIKELCQLAPWQFSKSRHQYENSMRRHLNYITTELNLDK